MASRISLMSWGRRDRPRSSRRTRPSTSWHPSTRRFFSSWGSLKSSRSHREAWLGALLACASMHSRSRERPSRPSSASATTFRVVRPSRWIQRPALRSREGASSRSGPPSPSVAVPLLVEGVSSPTVGNRATPSQKDTRRSPSRRNGPSCHSVALARPHGVVRPSPAPRDLGAAAEHAATDVDRDDPARTREWR